ncbi:uncharacterized protein DUF1992 [Mumia flava]|uniref:Uncharacterized protein DUF1992 n=1 Tax=Mumia flava TaxID=1348852 RepID=A0A2M9B668_9ACTN|nr:DUF1992 domain-containing protein [Mumia flava]PJJ53422.1 uncharacterized protein DUF1992 [Mumia flava]
MSDDHDRSNHDRTPADRPQADRRRGRQRSGWVDPDQVRVDEVLYVDRQIRAAMDRGEFDDLPLAGKPIPGIDDDRSPDWWVRRLVERERITGVLPEALQLRKDDAALDGSLDRLGSAAQVRDAVDAFNRRVVEARRQLRGGPPVVTATRDVDDEVARWDERRRRRRAG